MTVADSTTRLVSIDRTSQPTGLPEFRSVTVYIVLASVEQVSLVRKAGRSDGTTTQSVAKAVEVYMGYERIGRIEFLLTAVSILLGYERLR